MNMNDLRMRANRAVVDLGPEPVDPDEYELGCQNAATLPCCLRRWQTTTATFCESPLPTNGCQAPPRIYCLLRLRSVEPAANATPPAQHVDPNGSRAWRCGRRSP